MSTDSMKELALLCTQMNNAEAAAEAAERAMKDHKADARRIAEEDIPGLMAELGLQKVVLDSGETISVGLEVYAGITEARKAEAYRWLEENGFGGIISTDVSVHFSREEKDRAQEFFNKLVDEGIAPELNQSIHASRLKSFLKERIEYEANNEVVPEARIPLETFGARPVNTAKIKKPKASAVK